MAGRSEYNRTDDFWASLPVRAQLKLVAAIFFTFATIGIITDMWQVHHQREWPWVVAMGVISGAIALSWALAFIRSKIFFFLIPITIFLQAFVTGISVDGGTFFGAGDEEISRRLIIEGVACIGAIAAGYIFFVVFIWKEGAGQLRLRTEVSLAQDIHDTLVPPIAVITSRFDVYGRSSASTEVGGDLLDLYQKDGDVTVTVADVSGHGVSAGAMMGMVKSAMRMRLLVSSDLSQLVDDLNRVVHSLKSEEMFVTFACLRFDSTNAASVSLAGHPPILHYEKAAGTINRIDGADMPLGVVPDHAFTIQSFEFATGDLFIMLTDGILEVVNDADEEFGDDDIQTIVLANYDRPLADIVNLIAQAAHEHGVQDDDQTLVIVRVLEGESTV